MALAAHLEGISSARSDVWERAQLAETCAGEEWAEATTRSYELAVHMWNPPVKDVARARDVVGRALVDAILGIDAESAADRAAEGLDVILREEDGQ